jgi:hypothetical protein
MWVAALAILAGQTLNGPRRQGHARSRCDFIRAAGLVQVAVLKSMIGGVHGAIERSSSSFNGRDTRYSGLTGFDHFFGKYLGSMKRSSIVLAGAPLVVIPNHLPFDCIGLTIGKIGGNHLLCDV